ncbi:hypothetical protein ACPEEL_02235 [Pasteurella sp. PK-2025]|uniref:hypothetical protein n=1 Tax=unclassified Pasteurella TaxID=2621516 RepID=UPI003C766DF3
MNSYIIELLISLEELSLWVLVISILIAALMSWGIFTQRINQVERKLAKQVINLCLVLFILSLACVILIPTKETLMIIYGV